MEVWNLGFLFVSPRDADKLPQGKERIRLPDLIAFPRSSLQASRVGRKEDSSKTTWSPFQVGAGGMGYHTVSTPVDTRGLGS